MNCALQLIRSNWPGIRDRLPLESPPSHFALVTPRFRASKHAVFLCFVPADEIPVLVVKTPRLPGDSIGLRKEFENLEALRQYDSTASTVPKPLWFGFSSDREFLVQSFIRGKLLDRKTVAQNPQNSIDSTLHWLLTLNGESRKEHSEGTICQKTEYLKNLLEALEVILSPGPREVAALEKTRGIASELLLRIRQNSVPLVHEHGDLSAPNLLIGKTGALRVIDWETGAVDGLPATDLFFFLTFVAFSKLRNTDSASCIRAFEGAFFSDAEGNAWAAPVLERYGSELGLDRTAFRALFVICWCQYVVRLAERITSAGSSISEVLKHDSESVGWLRRNRYFQLWLHAVENLERLAI